MIELEILHFVQMLDLKQERERERESEAHLCCRSTQATSVDENFGEVK